MKNKIWLSCWMLLCCQQLMATDPPEEGRLMFNSRCAGCHSVNKVLTGPALAGIETRHTLGWISSFIRSSRSMILSGDTAALAVYERFNRVPMPDHPDLSEEQVNSILEYIRADTKELAEKSPFSKPGKLRPAYRPLPLRLYWYYLGYLGVVLIMSAVLMLFVRVKMVERREHEQDHKIA